MLPRNATRLELLTLPVTLSRPSAYPNLQAQTAQSCSSRPWTIPPLMGEFLSPSPLPTHKAAPTWLSKELERDSWREEHPQSTAALPQTRRNGPESGQTQWTPNPAFLQRFFFLKLTLLRTIQNVFALEKLCGRFPGSPCLQWARFREAVSEPIR